MPHYTSALVRTNTRWKGLYDSLISSVVTVTSGSDLALCMLSVEQNENR
jgi:hypothetical protein